MYCFTIQLRAKKDELHFNGLDLAQNLKKNLLRYLKRCSKATNLVFDAQFVQAQPYIEVVWLMSKKFKA